MHQLFKSMTRSSMLFRSTMSPLAMNQIRIFSTKPPGYPVGAETSVADVADIFKVNYTVEFD